MYTCLCSLVGYAYTDVWAFLCALCFISSILFCALSIWEAHALFSLDSCITNKGEKMCIQFIIMGRNARCGGFTSRGRKIWMLSSWGELEFCTHLFRGSLNSCFGSSLCHLVSSPFASPWGVGILEHFASVVLIEVCSFNWFCLAFDHLFEFFVHLFSFSLFYELVTMCLVNALIEGEIEDRSIREPVVGRSLVWWVIDNVLWTNSWSSIAGAGCGMICVGACEERERKVLACVAFEEWRDK
jgi:hypothetical protein